MGVGSGSSSQVATYIAHTYGGGIQLTHKDASPEEHLKLGSGIELGRGGKLVGLQTGESVVLYPETQGIPVVDSAFDDRQDV